jgi:HDOD domain
MEKQKVSSKTPLANNALLQAVTYVNDGWFPINPETLNEIKEKLKAGVYNQNYDLFIEDIKSDLSLFGFCIKELCNQLEKCTTLEEVSPKALIKKAGIEKLKLILNSLHPSNFRHSLSNTPEHNIDRLSETLVSACTSESLANSQAIDGDLAFSCAIFRQLGLTLVAWNYPHVYQKVLQTNSSRFEIELAISRILGFSPTTLGIACAKSWKLPNIVLQAMGDKNAKLSSESNTHSKLGSTLEKFCQIGELFAQITIGKPEKNNPSDWSRASNEILKNIGQQGFDIIKKRIEQTSQYYLKSLPGIFNIPEIVSTTKNPRISKGIILYKNNPYINKLHQDIQKELSSLYTLIAPDTLSKEVVEQLTSKAIPSSGFLKGCIYLLDAGTTRLMPRLAIGESKINQFSEIDYTSAEAKRNFIVEAYGSNTTILQHKITLSGYKIKALAASLGNTQRAGVLYLEPSTQLSESNQDQLMIFKALLTTLNDCLGLT